MDKLKSFLIGLVPPIAVIFIGLMTARYFIDPYLFGVIFVPLFLISLFAPGFVPKLSNIKVVSPYGFIGSLLSMPTFWIISNFF